MSSTVTPSFNDRTFLTFDGAGQTSQYHCYAEGLPDDRPLGLCIQLHGDAAFEFKNPGSTYSFAGPDGMIANAKARGFLFVPVLTPNPDETWWTTGAANGDYLAALIAAVTDAYDIDPARMWAAGFSGGAQQITKWLLPDHGGLFEQGGGASITGGGGRRNTQTPAQYDPFSAEFKANVRPRWWTGQDDTGTSPEWYNALQDAQNGLAWYQARDVQASGYWHPGVAHNLSGRFGPILGRHMDEVDGPPQIGAWTYTRVGQHPTIGTADLAVWEGYVRRIPQITLRSTVLSTVTLGSGGYARDGNPDLVDGWVQIETPVGKNTIQWHLEAQLLAGGKVVYGGQESLPLAYGSTISGGEDPAGMTAVPQPNGILLACDPSPTPGVTFYDWFRRTPPTGAPFDPAVDMRVASTAGTSYLDTEAPEDVPCEFQVFGRIPSNG